MPDRMKQTIAQAFMELTKKKNVDKITVKDLVESCGISRQTFYYHFQDIIDVIEWSVERSLSRAVAEGRRINSEEDMMRIFVGFANTNHDIMQRLMRSRKREQVEKIMVSAIQVYLEKMFREKAPEIAVNSADMEFMLRFCSYGMAGVLFKYHSNDPDEIRPMIKRLHRMLTAAVNGYCK